MPRTTIDIDAPILRDLKRLQKRERKSLGRLVSDLLAQALRQPKGGPTMPALTWTSRRMDARVNLMDKEAVQGILDRTEP
jgi:hypothetical protein